MKNKLHKGDIIRLRGAPSDEHIPENEKLDTTRQYVITETSTEIPCGSGQAVKIDGHTEWIDSAWCIREKHHWQAFKEEGQ